MSIIRQRITSRLESWILRAMLCAIRRFGFHLALNGSHMIYEWVSGRDGSFDHWFHSAEGNYAIWTAKWQLGFWRLLWQILTQSQLLIGKRRRSHNQMILDCSEEYYCAEPLFRLRALSRRPHTKPNANPRLVIDAVCTSCGQICDKRN
jgi:hypothetical protein